jgi:predicted phosphodiesterase
MEYLSMNFGQLFQCPLVNTSVNPTVISVDGGEPIKMLLLSDTHLGATGAANVNKCIDVFLTEVGIIKKQEGITHICHLGDLLDGTILDIQPLKRALLGLAALGVPVYAIGGNHDRPLFAQLPKDMARNLYITTELAWLMDIKPRPGRRAQKIFLAHDLGNNYRVRDQCAWLFLMWIKDACKGSIRPTDWLVTGHCHCAFVSQDRRLACVGQFSPEISAYGYGILEIDTTVSVMTKYVVSKMP